MPLFNAVGRKKVDLHIYNILTMDFWPFHALRTWKVHVVIFSFHANHFHTWLTPLDCRYVNARYDIRYTMQRIFTDCLPPLPHDSTSGVSISQGLSTNRSNLCVLDMYVIMRITYVLTKELLTYNFSL